jgi:thymidylate synthase
MLQYFALLLAVAQVTELEPDTFVHSFSDAHIYERQRDNVKKLLDRTPNVFPTLCLDPGIRQIEDIRSHHFVLDEYHPNPALPMPTPV